MKGLRERWVLNLHIHSTFITDTTMECVGWEILCEEGGYT